MLSEDKVDVEGLRDAIRVLTPAFQTWIGAVLDELAALRKRLAERHVPSNSLYWQYWGEVAHEIFPAGGGARIGTCTSEESAKEIIAAHNDAMCAALRAQADARPVAWSANWIRDQIADQIDMWPLATMTVWQIADHVRKIAITAPEVEASAPGLSETVENTIKTIERQLELISERAPGDYLDKRPVVQSLNAHIQRLRKALTRASAATVAEPSQSFVATTPQEVSEMLDRIVQQAEPVGDECAEIYLQDIEALMRACVQNIQKWSFPEYDSAHRAVKKLRALFAAQSGQRAGVAEYLQQIARAIEEDYPEQAYNLRLFIAGAAPTQQQEGGL